MRLRAMRLGAAFMLLALGTVGCEGMNDTVAPEKNSAVERSDDRSPFGNGDDDTATVYVVHGINGMDLGADEALPVDIAVNGDCVLEDVEFRDIEGPLRLDEGKYDLAVYLDADRNMSCEGDPAIEASDVPLDEGDNVSVAAHLTDEAAPTLTPFTNDVSAKPGKTRISARHAANFGAVDVVVDGAKPFTGVMNGQQGGAFLRPGSHTVALTPAGEMARVFELTSDFEPFTLYAAYAVGTPRSDDAEMESTFEVLLQTIAVGPKKGDDDEDDGDDEDDRDDDEYDGDDGDEGDDDDSDDDEDDSG